MVSKRRYIQLSHPPMPAALCSVLNLPEPRLDWRARFGDGQGKANQTATTTMFNHHGTHIDAPLHVFADGKAIDSFRPEQFIFDQVGIVHCHEPVRPIQVSDFADSLDLLHPSARRIELLLIKTGWEWKRDADPEAYVRHGPGFAAEAAHELRRRFPSLRAIGFDMFGVEHIASGRAEGWPVHKAFLSDPPLLVVEDMRLAEVEQCMSVRVFALPLMMPAEAMPVNVVAEIILE
ncbi:MAG: cyclase family protein [Planctomycetes bacterium]|nr:cyclase family protein [Planctomycetota bacterium]